MRAYYATHKHIRVFVFGTPEGWHTAAYDLQRKEWLPMGGRIHDTLKDAKAAAEATARGLLRSQPGEMKWH